MIASSPSWWWWRWCGWLEYSSFSFFFSLRYPQLSVSLSHTSPLPAGDFEKVDWARIKAIMEAYDATGDDWQEYQSWHLDKNYSRTLIATDDKMFTLMLLCWKPGKYSAIHDHSGVQCHLRVVQGQVEEVQYEMPNDGEVDSGSVDMVQMSASTLVPGEVGFINDSIGLHKIGNPTEEKSVTLHLYTPPYTECHCFCPKTGAVNVAPMKYDVEDDAARKLAVLPAAADVSSVATGGAQ
jgi:cysteine dioxygenase